MSEKLTSPWIEQLHRTRKPVSLTSNHRTNIAVVGAGIAGISTVYFLLTRTRKRVTLIEATRAAHGATGHNAGQLVSYFERPFTDIIDEFGLEMALEGQDLVKSSWDLIADIQSDLDLKTPYLVFDGFAGLMDLHNIVLHLTEHKQQKKTDSAADHLFISDTFKDLQKIPKSLKKFYTLVPHETILDLLQTKDQNYIAALSGKKGCMNSARFSEEVIEKLLLRYPRRLTFFENTPVNKVKLYKHHVELITKDHAAHAKRVVLCTNGFEHFKIENHAGANIDTKFHHLVRGSVGYMAAFTETPPMPPTAISYLPSPLHDPSGAYDADPYFYLTRRPNESDLLSSLICIGGPESLMDDTTAYKKEHPYPTEAKRMIDDFVRRTYRHAGKQLTYTHFWHGLMGYTPNGIRCIGAEPCNTRLLYNLGCNGVGILPSIYGGLRIAQILKGDSLKPSIFDPTDLRCALEGNGAKETTTIPAIQLEKHPILTLLIYIALIGIICILLYKIL